MSATGDGEPLVAWVLLDPAGTSVSERDGDVVLPAASTIKLVVLLALLRAVDDGTITLDRSVTVSSTTASAAGGGRTIRPDPEDADPEFPPDGAEATVAALAGMMIERSSNEATNVLLDLLGAMRIADTVGAHGLGGTVVARKLGDVPAQRAGLENRTSAADLARTMHALVAGRALSAVSTEFARAVLARQRFPHIARELPPGSWWGSKSGWVPGVVHDVAAFATDGEAADASVLAVCTRGLDEAQGDAVIRSVGSVLQSCFLTR
ncbi:serine hydrolase [Curtobacterium sp. MCBA15_008]|uniref:serine hydrolase n=1 Tax=Curtobacterium sp. MCBA15_008 TaxID=1898736 RepID=UPI001587CCF4|nr:serine hydrolase [Curtobacterium sp. MCBA15_008]